MINLQDAIERARLGADEDGLLSNYLYDQITQQLAQEDKYAFTMALVDLGIHTKLGSNATYRAMVEILGKDYYDEEDEYEEELDPEDARYASIVDQFVKAAQAFRRQTPSGLWVPDSYEPGDEDPPEEPEPPPIKEPKPEPTTFSESQDEYQTFLESTPFTYFPGREPYSEEEVIKKAPKEGPSESESEPEVDPEFAEVSTDELVETLEGSGVLLDSDGNVTLYNQNIPGLYTEKIKSWKSQPLDTAINRLNMEADSVDREQERISSLQDVITSVNQDFEAIEQGGKLKDYVPRFQENLDKLQKFKYSDKSTNPEIASIAQDLSLLRQYLEPSTQNVKKVKQDILKLRPVLSKLKTKLDEYYQTQYERYDDKLAVIDALEKVQNLREKSPEQFQQVVDEIGGITASRFIRAFMERYSFEYEESSSPYDALEVDVGDAYLKSILGDDAYRKFEEIGGFEAEEFEDLKSQLKSALDIEYNENSDDYGVKFDIIPGDKVEAYRGVGSGDYDELTSQEIQMIKDKIQEDLQIFIKEIG